MRQLGLCQNTLGKPVLYEGIKETVIFGWKFVWVHHEYLQVCRVYNVLNFKKNLIKRSLINFRPVPHFQSQLSVRSDSVQLGTTVFISYFLWLSAFISYLFQFSVFLFLLSLATCFYFSTQSGIGLSLPAFDYISWKFVPCGAARI